MSDKSIILDAEDGMNKLKSFKYAPISPIESYRGATKYYSEIKNKMPSSIKFEVQPKDLNFDAVEIWVPMYKNFTVKNVDKLKNIEIASIISESSQITIEHDIPAPMILRPNKKINIKVTVVAQVKGKFKENNGLEPVSTVITFTLKNGYKVLYLVKFLGINNSYNIEPMIVDKAKQPSNMINFVIDNQADEDLEFILSDVHGKFQFLTVNSWE